MGKSARANFYKQMFNPVNTLVHGNLVSDKYFLYYKVFFNHVIAYLQIKEIRVF